MEQKNVFELSHVVLWLKGWYDHTEDKWKDLATMLNLDGHPGYKSKGDITRCLVYYYNEWCNYVNTNLARRALIPKVIIFSLLGMFIFLVFSSISNY